MVSTYNYCVLVTRAWSWECRFKRVTIVSYDTHMHTYTHTHTQAPDDRLPSRVVSNEPVKHSPRRTLNFNDAALDVTMTNHKGHTSTRGGHTPTRGGHTSRNQKMNSKDSNQVCQLPLLTHCLTTYPLTYLYTCLPTCPKAGREAAGTNGYGSGGREEARPTTSRKGKTWKSFAESTQNRESSDARG